MRLPLSSEYGTYKTGEAPFWAWRQGKSPTFFLVFPVRLQAAHCWREDVAYSQPSEGVYVSETLLRYLAGDDAPRRECRPCVLSLVHTHIRTLSHTKPASHSPFHTLTHTLSCSHSHSLSRPRQGSFVGNNAPARHRPPGVHTLSLSHTLSLTHTHLQSHLYTLTMSRSVPHSLSHSLTLSLSHSLALSFELSLSRVLFHTLTHSHSLRRC